VAAEYRRPSAGNTSHGRLFLEAKLGLGMSGRKFLVGWNIR